MFIDKDGNSYGSIGGGNVEFQALKYAPEAQHGEIRKYNLSNQGGANLGMICGGEVEVLYELLQINTEPTALLFAYHYPARCFGMNMPKSRDIQAKILLPQAIWNEFWLRY